MAKKVAPYLFGHGVYALHLLPTAMYKANTVTELINVLAKLVTCEASRFDSSSNRTSDSGFDSY